jgi:hypothetical protein
MKQGYLARESGRLSALFLTLFNLDYFLACISTAGGAIPVRQLGAVALRAFDQLRRGYGQVRSSVTLAGFGISTLWQWYHLLLLHSQKFI